MKLEINIDEDFIKSKLDIREVSFSRSLDILKARASYARRIKKKRFPTFVLDNKLIGYNFAKKCGHKTPSIIQAGVSIDQVEWQENTVVKPMYENSGRGVFIVHNKDNISYLNKNIIYNDFDSARNHAKKMIDENIIQKDYWMVEELLLIENGIARDVKFYCFYGTVGLILETKRVPKIRRCWYDSDLNYTDTGKYSTILFKGKRDDLLELKKIAETLSLDIPTPFVRIDFLVCNGKYYVGEFTPSPGGYHKLNNEWDAKLGELFINASIDIAQDIAIGKKFDNYVNCEKTEKLAIVKLTQ